MASRHGFAAVAAGFAAAACSLVLFASSASATGATMKAVPNTGLSNGSVVKVKGSGFPASTQLYLVECLKSATTEAGCDISTATAVTTTASGVLPKTKFTVVTGTVGTGKCGTSSSNEGKCVIVAGDISGTEYAAAKITFNP
jgi:hypothetical protein